MVKTTIPIKGMHCRSCEILITEQLKAIPDVKNVHVSYKTKEAVIYSKHEIPKDAYSPAIKTAGYEIGSETLSLVNGNATDWRDIFLAAALLIILYFIAKKFGLFNIDLGQAKNPTSLLVVFVIGLTAGLSTCMALVGGLILGISARFSEKHPEASSIQKFRPHLYFNMGRILSYLILGGVVGWAGSALQFSSGLLGLIMIAVGLVMIILGLQLTEIFPRLSSSGPTLPKSLSHILRINQRQHREYSHFNSIVTGALTFFLPCGFTQAMQFYAMSTGSFASGALIMGLFALGTAPGLLSIGGLTSIIKGALAKRFFKIAGLLVIALAVLNISNGYHLTGWNVPAIQDTAANPSQLDSNVVFSDGVQIVRMNQSTYGYSPSKFTVKQNIPVRWIITSSDNNTCASSISSAKLGIQKTLSLGENIIEFTPKETGTINFSCSMGMYRGSFVVVASNPNNPYEGLEPKDWPHPNNPTNIPQATP